MIEAERKAAYGQVLEAIEIHQQAIRYALENHFVQYEALGEELCAKLWAARGHIKYARIHMQDAYYLYSQWGAIGKCRHLRQHYSSLLELRDTDLPSDNTLDMDSSVLDVLTIFKASQTLSNEIRLEQLLDNMMKIIIENAGAQKGVFILAESKGNLLVVAEGGKDDMQIDTLRAVPLSSYP